MRSDNGHGHGSCVCPTDKHHHGGNTCHGPHAGCLGDKVRSDNGHGHGSCVCPGTKHAHGNTCHAPHSCSVDEIGGGDKDCEKCTLGEVPNASKTACDPCMANQVERPEGRCDGCLDGKRPNASKSDCIDCGRDEAGTGGTCSRCPPGQVPNSARTDCEDCQHGESETPGICNDAPCGGNCPANSDCIAGTCRCRPGYSDPNPGDDVLQCTDPCAGVWCGTNGFCSDGSCFCNSGYEGEAPNCTEICTQSDLDAKAKASLGLIPKEPWERGEAYWCANGKTKAGSVKTSESKYKANLSCGRDRIRTGSVPNVKCEKCGNGEVPNAGYTACIKCPSRESTRGQCSGWATCSDCGSSARCFEGQCLCEMGYEKDADGKCVAKDADVCAVGLAFRLAAGHSHPFFKDPRDVGVWCGPTKLSGGRIDLQNQENSKISGGDKSAADAAGRPIYLIVPERNRVKVYRPQQRR